MQDATYQNSMVVLWTGLESTLGVTCACIVVMRPLFGKLRPKQQTDGTSKYISDPPLSSDSRKSWTQTWMRSQKNTPRLGGNGAESENEQGPGRFQRLKDAYDLRSGGQARATNTTTIRVGSTGGTNAGVGGIETSYPQRSLSHGAIMVKRECGVDSLIV